MLEERAIHITRKLILHQLISYLDPNIIVLFCNGGGFLSVKDAFSETGYPAFYR